MFKSFVSTALTAVDDMMANDVCTLNFVLFVLRLRIAFGHAVTDVFYIDVLPLARASLISKHRKACSHVWGISQRYSIQNRKFKGNRFLCS